MEKLDAIIHMPLKPARLIWVALALGLAACGKSPDLPWCAHWAHSGSAECAYYTRAQCEASVFGVGGYCTPNYRTRDFDRPRRLRAR